MRYPGGKGRCYQQIINVMPPHRIYIEAFLGGGSVLRHKRPAQRSIGIDIDPAVIERWRDEPSLVAELRCGDACDFLGSFDYSGDELVYADPPYLPRTRRRMRCYRHDFADCDHDRLLVTLKSLPCPVILSGYPSTTYDEALEGWSRVHLQGTSHTGSRAEVLWLNFTPNGELHDYRYLGQTFRDRQRVRRMTARWRRRLQAMPPAERRALLEALNADVENDQ
jgi:DNA adenine methylase